MYNIGSNRERARRSTENQGGFAFKDSKQRTKGSLSMRIYSSGETGDLEDEGSGQRWAENDVSGGKMIRRQDLLHSHCQCCALKVCTVRRTVKGISSDCIDDGNGLQSNNPRRLLLFLICEVSYNSVDV